MWKNRSLCWIFTLLFTPLLSAQEHTFYVSPDTPEASWQTIQHAVEISRQQAQHVKIVLRGGEYVITEPIRIDNGLHITLVAADGETPVLQGAVTVKGWQKVTDKAVIDRLPHEAAGKVWQATLDGADFDLIDGKNRIDFYYNGQRMHMARWPNQSYTFSGKALGKLPPLEEKNYRNYKGCAEGFFEYKDARINKWAEEKEVYLHGYWFWDWAEEYKKVAKIDTIRHAITLTLPHHHYGYRNEFRFYGMNLLCELDTVGEYYVDKESNTIYLYPPADFNPAANQVTASSYNADYMLSVENSSQIVIQGLTMQGGRNGAINIDNCQDVSIKDCRMVQFGDDAITLKASKNCQIQGCLLDQLGHGGIAAVGGNRKTLAPADYLVENTLISNFSLYKPTYEPAVVFDGAGLTIRHCHFTNSASSALRLNGNDILVEYNRFENLVKESDDQGALDAWFDITYRGVVIRYNYWKNITGRTVEGAAAIRLDDLISGFVVEGNVFENCGGGKFGAVQINGGKDNLITNNLMYRCHKLYSTSKWTDKRWQDVVSSERVQRQIQEFDFPSKLYKERYPELKNDSVLLPPPNRSFIFHNLSVNAEIAIPADEKQCVLQGNVEIKNGKSSLSYYLQSKRLKKYGLTPIPFEKMGIQNNKFVKNVSEK